MFKAAAIAIYTLMFPAGEVHTFITWHASSVEGCENTKDMLADNALGAFWAIGDGDEQRPERVEVRCQEVSYSDVTKLIDTYSKVAKGSD